MKNQMTFSQYRNLDLSMMLGMLAITLVLILGIILGSALKSGKRTDGLYYQAAGIRPDAQLLRIEDELLGISHYGLK